MSHSLPHHCLLQHPPTSAPLSGSCPSQVWILLWPSGSTALARVSDPATSYYGIFSFLINCMSGVGACLGTCLTVRAVLLQACAIHFACTGNSSLPLRTLCAEDFEDLAQRLGALAQQHRSAPMVTLAGVGPAATKQPQEQASSGQLVISDDLDEADGEGSGSIVSQSSQETHGVVAASPDASPMRSSANGTGNKHKGARRTSRHEDWEFV